MHEHKVKDTVEVVKSVADELKNVRHVSLVVDGENGHHCFKIFEEENQNQGICVLIISLKNLFSIAGYKTINQYYVTCYFMYR